MPVNNFIAERQFNLSELYLHDKSSELSKQASITFVENILHGGNVNGRTTEAARQVRMTSTRTYKSKTSMYEERMKAYGLLLTTELLQEARKNFNGIRKGSVVSGPLTAKHVYPKAWEKNKVNKDTSMTI